MRNEEFCGQVVKLPSRQGGDVSAQRKLGRDGVEPLHEAPLPPGS